MTGTTTELDQPDFSAAVARIKELDSVEVAFAARLDRKNQTFVLGQFNGARTEHLQGLVSPIDAGLGGRCITLGRPVFVADYVVARGITHQYDRPVTQEGLRAVFAVPVRDKRGIQGVVYGAARRPLTFGDRLLGAAVGAVRHLNPVSGTDALRGFTDASSPLPEDPSPVWTTQDIQELHAELRAIAGGVADPIVRKRLHALSDKLSKKTHRDGQAGCPVELSPREIDVLTEVAVGCGNAEAAARLGLTLETTKSYLKSAMFKLDSHNRMEAVHRARCNGLLP